jgi:hypothetical protein
VAVAKDLAVWQLSVLISDVIGCESLLKYFPHIHNTAAPFDLWF